MPGGESTTIHMLLDHNKLREPLTKRLNDGMPAFGTCAGMILLAGEVIDGRPDQTPLAQIDLTVQRNGYGRQLASFETDLQVTGLGDAPFPGIFIRAPVVSEVRGDTEVLASYGDHPVLCRQGSILVASFHPELSADRRLHELFCSLN